MSGSDGSRRYAGRLGRFLRGRAALIAVTAIIAIVVAGFFMVARRDLARFETSDEDLWRETRIPQYWTVVSDFLGGEEPQWAKTYINDKPGVLLAIVAGMNLSELPDPTKQEISRKTNGKYLFKKFNAENIETINEGMRMPLIVFTAAMIAIILALVYRLSGSVALTAFSGGLIAFSPVLVGMSRILNPDATLWTTMTAAILAYLIAVRRLSWGYALLAGVFFGAALLSKYTANLFIPFALVILFATMVDEERPREDFGKGLRTRILQLGLIAISGSAIFAALCPAVILEPRLLAEGTVLSRGIAPVAVPLGVFLGALILDAFLNRGTATYRIVTAMRRLYPAILRLLAFALLTVILMNVANAWTGATFQPLNDLREITEHQTGVKGSAAISLVFPAAEQSGAVAAFAKKIIVQSANTVFTLPAVTVILLVAGCALVLARGRTRFGGYALFALSAPWVFIGGGLLADVFVNVRYGILLQPILAVLAAIFAVELASLVVPKFGTSARVSLMGAIALFQAHALYSIEPHPLNYQNGFLPDRFSIADSWSYGEYEAAQWLNDRPNARLLQVWTDREAMCRYFVGKCIRSSKIDRELISPDYFVITRRNVAKGSRFVWKNGDRATHDPEYYYRDESLDNPAWEILIGGRPLNYVKIIRSEDDEDLPPIPEDPAPSDTAGVGTGPMPAGASSSDESEEN